MVGRLVGGWAWSCPRLSRGRGVTLSDGRRGGGSCAPRVGTLLSSKNVKESVAGVRARAFAHAAAHVQQETKS